MGDAAKFQIPLFGGRMNFSVWRSTVEDLLVQQGIHNALEISKPTSMDKEKRVAMKKKAASTIRLAIAPKIKYNYLKDIDPVCCWRIFKQCMLQSLLPTSYAQDGSCINS